jgi:hypothetical protein
MEGVAGPASLGDRETVTPPLWRDVWAGVKTQREKRAQLGAGFILRFEAKVAGTLSQS